MQQGREMDDSDREGKGRTAEREESAQREKDKGREESEEEERRTRVGDWRERKAIWSQAASHLILQVWLPMTLL